MASLRLVRAIWPELWVYVRTQSRDSAAHTVGKPLRASLSSLNVPNLWCKMATNLVEGGDVTTYQVSRLAGMRDLTGTDYDRLTQAAESFVAYMAKAGYEVIDTPLLEETELFVRKSGGELTSRLYSFIDPGGRRVSLRPEFTPSIIRHFVQEKASPPKSMRWQYNGPVFRHEQQDGKTYRQFTQVGAELIGSGGIDADAEVLALASESLGEMGLKNYQMRIGHLGILHSLLDTFGLSERAKQFVISNVGVLRDGQADQPAFMQKARDVGVLRAKPGSGADGGATSTHGEGTPEFIHGVLSGAMSGPVGRRTAEQIVERLMRKAREADSPEVLERALALIGDIVQVVGSPPVALERARGIAEEHGVGESLFDGLDGLFAALDQRGLVEPQIGIDFGLVRGIAYYTGVTFELVYPASPDGVVVGGGGRYDGLVRALGGNDVPALGYAYTLEHLIDAIDIERSGAPRKAAVSSVAKENRATSGRS